MGEKREKLEESGETESNDQVKPASVPTEAESLNVSVSESAEVDDYIAVEPEDMGKYTPTFNKTIEADMENMNSEARSSQKASINGTESSPERELLFNLGEVNVYVSLTEHQRFLPIDGLVIPVGVRGGLAGGFVQSLKREIDPNVWTNIKTKIKDATKDGISPNAPALVELTDLSISQKLLPNALEPKQTSNYYLIAATAGGAEGVRELSAAATAIIRLAIEAGIRRLAVLPLGTGRGPFKNQAKAVGALMIRGIRIALAQFPSGHLEEVILATRDVAVASGAREEVQLFERNVAQPVLSDEPAWNDTLGVGTVANALAETLLLRQVEPPVTVGVFGSWGSGKTTFMRLMQRRMAEIRALPITRGWSDDPGESELPYFAGHIYQIQFNAWTYAKSNLWASLMQRIFSELNRQLAVEDHLRNEGYDPLAGSQIYPDWLYGSDRIWDPNLLWETLRRRNQKELEALQKTEREIGRVKTECDSEEAKQQANLIAKIDKEPLSIPVDLLASRAYALAGDVSEDTLKQVLDETSDTVDSAQVEEVLNSFRSLRIIAQKVSNSVYQRRWVSILYAFIALLIIVGIFLLTKLIDLEQTQRQMAMLFSLVGTLLPILSSILRVSRNWLNEVDQADEEFEAWSERQRKKRLNEEIHKTQSEQTTEVYRALELVGLDVISRKKALKELAELGNLVAYKYRLEELEAKATRQRSQIGPPAEFDSLPEFIQERLDSKLYANKLGFMHQVEGDIKQLSDSLMVWSEDFGKTVDIKKELFPRGRPRVILYIDDLDRCPPQRVVEVLEAVQLLLNKGLFIVVLALDTRYATRALEKYYQDILIADGDPSGLDYVEKIIGIPYRVQPVTSEGLENYLTMQMDIREDEFGEPTDSTESTPEQSQTITITPKDILSDSISYTKQTAPEELPPHIVKFLPEDKIDLQYCCQQIRLTPRGIKRIINVFKLLEIYWFRTLQTDPPRSVKRTMIGLLALSAGYPEIMREAFVQLERSYINQQSAQKTIGAVLTDFVEAGAMHHLPAGLVERFRTDLDALIRGFGFQEPELERFFDVKLSEFSLTLLDTVRSFSYVGDPSYIAVESEKV